MSASASETEHLWFLDTLVAIRVSEHDGSDGLSVLEHRAPQGDSPPLHLHRSEDEIFHILEGDFRFQIGQEKRRLGPGDTFLIPKGVPHSYRVESAEGGHWLTVTSQGDFERFVRVMSRVAERAELPERAGAPGPEAVAVLTNAAKEYGIELVGPPLS